MHSIRRGRATDPIFAVAVLAVQPFHYGRPIRPMSGLVVGEFLARTRIGKGLDRGAGRGPSVRGAIDKTDPSVDQVATSVGGWRGAVLSVALGQWITSALFSRGAER